MRVILRHEKHSRLPRKLVQATSPKPSVVILSPVHQPPPLPPTPTKANMPKCRVHVHQPQKQGPSFHCQQNPQAHDTAHILQTTLQRVMIACMNVATRKDVDLLILPGLIGRTTGITTWGR